jgi:hypothetical protein
MTWVGSATLAYGIYKDQTAPDAPTAQGGVRPDKIEEYTSPFGTATATGVSAYADPNQAAIDSAQTGLAGVVGGGLGAGDAQIQQYRDAYTNARSPALERNLAQQAQQQNIQSATRGTAGSSSDLYQQALQNQFANEQRGVLQNQAIQGGEALSNQALNQDIARANLYGKVGQQGFANQLQAAQFGANALGSSQNSANNFAAVAGGQQQIGYDNQLNAYNSGRAADAAQIGTIGGVANDLIDNFSTPAETETDIRRPGAIGQQSRIPSPSTDYLNTGTNAFTIP